MKIKEGEGNDEYLIVRNDKFEPPLNIISFYGENECRASHSQLFDSWQRLLCDIKKIELRNENLIIASDMNRKVGNDQLGIKGNTNEISYGGSLVRSLISTGKYVFANNSDKRVGGPNTRIDPSDSSKGSVLDVVIVSKTLDKNIEKFIIDDEYKYAMQYPTMESRKKVFKKIIGHGIPA